MDTAEHAANARDNDPSRFSDVRALFEKRAKAYAARHGTTLAALVEEALRARLATAAAARHTLKVLPSFRGDGLQPGLSLDDTSAIYDRMDGVR